MRVRLPKDKQQPSKSGDCKKKAQIRTFYWLYFYWSTTETKFRSGPFGQKREWADYNRLGKRKQTLMVGIE